MQYRFTASAFALLALFQAEALLSQAPVPKDDPAVRLAERKPPPPAALAELPGTVEEMLAAALRSNPEVIQAEARVQQAQARLNQARLKVTQDVVTAFHERTKKRELIAIREQEANVLKRKTETGTATEIELQQAAGALIEVRAQLAQVEAQLRYLLGTGGSLPGVEGRADSSAERLGGSRSLAMPPQLPESMSRLLEKKVSMKLGAQPFSEVWPLLKDAFGDQRLVVSGGGPWLEVVPGVRAGWTLELRDVPLRTALLAITDLYGVAFVFREYGVLVVPREKAARYNAPTIPERPPASP